MAIHTGNLDEKLSVNLRCFPAHCSERLEELIETDFGGDWKELVGELQLSFLVFLQLSSLAALEQWKQVRWQSRGLRLPK